MLSQKRTFQCLTSNYALFCPYSDDVFNQLLSCGFLLVCLFIFFPSDCRRLFTGEKAKGEDASQCLFKISIFPFIEYFRSSLPTVLEMIR